MKKLFKLLFTLVLAIAIIIVAYVAYLKFFVKIRHNEALDAVPADAFVILETGNIYKAYEDLRSTQLWQSLLKAGYLSDYEQDIADIDTFLNRLNLPPDLIKSLPVIASVHKTGNTWDLLYVVDLQDFAKIKAQIEPVLFHIPDYKTFKQSVTVNGKRHDLYKLVYLPDQYDIIYVTFAGNLLLASYTKQLVVSALQATEQKFWSTNLDFAKLRTNLSPTADIHVYVNFAQLVPFVGLFQPADDPALQLLGNGLTYGAFDLKMQQNTVKLQGLVGIDSNALYFNALSHQKPQQLSSYRIMSDQTASFMSVNFSDFAGFYDDFMADYGRQDSAQVHEIRSYVQKLKKLFGFDLYRDFFSLIGNEISIYKLAPDYKDRMQDIVITIQTPTPDSASVRLERLMKKIRSVTPFSFKTIQYKGFKIGYLKISGLFNLILGKYFGQIDKPYYTIIENQIVFSNSPQTLEKVIDDYILGFTLGNTKKFRDFLHNFDEKNTFAAFAIVPNLYKTVYLHSNAQTRQFLASNKDLLISFARSGIQLVNRNGKYQIILSITYDPDAKLDAIVHQLEKQTAVERLLQQVDSLTFKITLGDTLPADGQFVQYYPGTNQIHIQGQVRNGKPFGIFRVYYPDGNLKITELFDENGMLTGTVQFFYDNKANSKLAEFPIDHDIINGTLTEYYENGQIKAQIRYKNSRRHGKALFYYPDGKLKIKGHYRNGKKHGIWTFYDKQGNTIKTKNEE